MPPLLFQFLRQPILITTILLVANHGYGLNKPNVLLICVDDLRPELKCFGASYVKSPNIDKLAAQGRPFHRHYVQAPTCGASRYTLLTGKYGPSHNGALFIRSQKIEQPSFPAWFRKNGYISVSVGKVSHHPGGRGGPNWNEDDKPEMPESWDRHLLPAGSWQHPRGAMHGLANGEIRKNAKDMDVYQAFDGPDTAYPDGLITEEALRQLDDLGNQADKKPFFLAVGIIRPHLPFGAPHQYIKPYLKAKLPPTPHPLKPAGKTTWHKSGEFMKYNLWDRNPNTDATFALEVRRHYAGCVTYADALVGRILDRLDQLKLRENTIVILWGDHGWHLGEHAIWGKHALFEESLRSPLIISYPGIPQPGKPTRSIVETLDIFPTVCELAGLKIPTYVDGQSLLPILRKPETKGHPAISYGKKGTLTIRTKNHRLITHEDGTFELYDHRSPDAETKNLAGSQSKLVSELNKTLSARINTRN
jgi:iduronate 2-sulfatase